MNRLQYWKSTTKTNHLSCIHVVFTLSSICHRECFCKKQQSNVWLSSLTCESIEWPALIFKPCIFMVPRIFTLCCVLWPSPANTVWCCFFLPTFYALPEVVDMCSSIRSLALSVTSFKQLVLLIHRHLLWFLPDFKQQNYNNHNQSAFLTV